jgi:hypothetical protein
MKIVPTLTQTRRVLLGGALLGAFGIIGQVEAQWRYPGHDHDVYINLFHPPGAECTFRRGGASLAVNRDQSRDPNIGFEVDWIDISASHGDVTLTCRTADGWEESRTLTYGPGELDSFVPACGPSTDGNSCPHAVGVVKSVIYGYLPGFIRMRRDDAVGGAP